MSLDWKFFEEKFPLLLNSLKNARSTGRLAHAHLIASSNGDYTNDFPPLLAMLAACENPNPDFSPCGKCPTCREMLEGTHPDTFILAPTSLSRIIPVGESDDDPDTMRSFEALFHLSSMSRCGWKIGIIHEADRMNENAQNAFLKTLEEPPEKCMFILTTAHPMELLPTIRSRCQALYLTDNTILYHFDGMETLLSAARKLLFSSRNDLIAAGDSANALIELLGGLKASAQSKVAEKWKDRLANMENLDSAGKNRLEKRIKSEEGSEYLKMRENVLSCFHAFFARAALLASGSPIENIPNPELFAPDDAEKVLKLDPDFVFRVLELAENLLRTLRTNANDELAIRSCCLKIAFK